MCTAFGVLVLVVSLVPPVAVRAAVPLDGDPKRSTGDPSKAAECPDAFFCGFPHWDRVLEREDNGCGFTYLGKGWVLTANHSPCSDATELRFVASGVRGRVLAGSVVRLFEPGTRVSARNAALLKIEALPGGPPLPSPKAPLRVAASAPAVGSELLFFGRALERGRALASPPGFALTNPGGPKLETRWGTNRIRQVARGYLSFSASCAGLGDAPSAQEAAAATGDSGAAVWQRDDEGWLLAGVVTVGATRRAGIRCGASLGAGPLLSSFRERIVGLLR